jgi:hypothetical protein
MVSYCHLEDVEVVKDVTTFSVSGLSLIIVELGGPKVH